MRLPNNTSAKDALKECCKAHKKPPECPKLTWITRVNKDLNEIDPSLKIGDVKLEELAQDKQRWRSLTRRKTANVNQ